MCFNESIVFIQIYLKLYLLEFYENCQWFKKDVTSIEYLIQIMRAYDPDSGCPWDIEQTFETIAPYTIEEAYEVADAINRRNMSELKDELGIYPTGCLSHTNC